MTIKDYMKLDLRKYREIKILAMPHMIDGTFIPLLESCDTPDELLTALQLSDRMRAGLATPTTPSPRSAPAAGWSQHGILE